MTRPKTVVALPSVARYDIAHGVSEGLFVTLRRGDRAKLDVLCEIGARSIRWRGSEQLDVGDESVVLALVALATPSRIERTKRRLAKLPDDMRASIGSALTGSSIDATIVSTTFHELALTAGVTDFSSTGKKRLHARLCRLAEVTLWVTENGVATQAPHPLVSAVVMSGVHLFVVLNPLLSAAIAGGQHVQVPMHERYGLDGDSAKRLHVYFCSRLHVGRAWSYDLDTLETVVYGNGESGDNRRMRLARIREAVFTVGDLPGWVVRFKSPTVVRVTRATGGKVANHEEAEHDAKRFIELRVLDSLTGKAFTSRRWLAVPRKLLEAAWVVVKDVLGDQWLEIDGKRLDRLPPDEAAAREMLGLPKQKQSEAVPAQNIDVPPFVPEAIDMHAELDKIALDEDWDACQHRLVWYPWGNHHTWQAAKRWRLEQNAGCYPASVEGFDAWFRAFRMEHTEFARAVLSKQLREKAVEIAA